MQNRVRPRFFDQVGHETMYASRHLVIVRFTENYEQSQQKLGTILENKVLYFRE